MMQACDGSYVWEGGRTRENRYLRRESRLKGEKRCERHDTPISLQIQRSHPYKHSTAPTFMSPHSHLFLMLSFFIPNFPAPSFISLFLTSADSQHSHFSAYDVLGTTKLCLKKIEEAETHVQPFFHHLFPPNRRLQKCFHLFLFSIYKCELYIYISPIKTLTINLRPQLWLD